MNGVLKTTEQIHNEARLSILNMPDGEYTVNGGLGNKKLADIKIENGVWFKLIGDEWVIIEDTLK